MATTDQGYSYTPITTYTGNPWDRQPAEPPRWFARFDRYRLTQAYERSIRGTWITEPAKTSEAQAAKARKGTPSEWLAAAAEWNWEERALLWDASLREDEEAKYREELSDIQSGLRLLNRRQLQAMIRRSKALGEPPTIVLLDNGTRFTQYPGLNVSDGEWINLVRTVTQSVQAAYDTQATEHHQVNVVDGPAAQSMASADDGFDVTRLNAEQAAEWERLDAIARNGAGR